MVAAAHKVRLDSLDVLRGIAVLGIFMMNVQAFAMVVEAYFNPFVRADFTGVNQGVWAVQNTVFNLKFLTIFSVLFGAGLALQLGSEPAREARSLYRSRLFWLLIFGLIHGFFFWIGDILTPYAVAGFIALLAVRWSVTRLLVTAGVLYSLFLLIAYGALWSIRLAPPEEAEAIIRTEWAPDADSIAAVIALYQQDFVSRLPGHALLNLETLAAQLIMAPTRILAAMYVGIALVKLGFFHAAGGVARYWLIASLTIAAGWSAGAIASIQQLAAEGALFDTLPWMVLTDVAAPITALGYGAVIVALCAGGGRSLTRTLFAPVGRMAFTAYLLSTLAGILVFYGPPGLGLIGALDHMEQVGVVCAVWLALVAFCHLWLRGFRLGPMEWLWRRLAYGPKRRPSTAPPPG